MPIRAQAAPSAVAETIDEMMRTLSGAGDASALGGAMQADATDALRLFSFGAESVGDGFSVDDAHQFGWRSVVISADGTQTFADVRQGSEGVSFSKVTQSPFVGKMIEAAHLVEQERAGADAELRVIEAPDLRISALWIAGETNEFVPFEGAPTTMLSEDQFRELVDRTAYEALQAFSLERQEQQEPGQEQIQNLESGQMSGEE